MCRASSLRQGGVEVLEGEEAACEQSEGEETIPERAVLAVAVILITTIQRCSCVECENRQQDAVTLG